ncbi:hypothetical protein HHL16_15330 [Pseudoflavitalea sp. G-6-1-2]|uniref:BclA C-terminal domain-containing protein n=1 Tax=Pseudoflavitalea sp. G-6-1-2 TaxID=2728841 RepID=UPI00146E14FB|nr:hypothetical protein [Pseudoflavitalea sp. G-6-1-2]NML22255.1 hypothetical protein [Pseudoflavitalea sp. G-6-1-2]
MKKQLCILVALFAVTVLNLNAQVGIGTTSPDPSAILDVTSTTKGVLPPRMTSGQRLAITTPADGLLVYQTGANAGYWLRLAGAWVRLATGDDLTGSGAGFASSTTGAVVAVLLGGTKVELPDYKSLGADITANATSDVFTVSKAGRYRISYIVNTTAALLMSSRITINGTPSIPLTFNPLLSVSTYQAEAIVTLAAGSTISLELFGLLGVAVLMNNAQGAALNIQRVD